MRAKFILVFVLLFFLTTRLFKIAEIPPSVYWDEASIGYNAYSIATDLKDEWGVKLPLHFRAFGEFKLPVYIYSVVPFVKVFGLNAFAVRLPAVLYTLGTLVIVYLLIRKITGNKNTAILAGFILSVSPWLFIFSRTGYEATAGLFFFLLGTYLFLLLDKNKYFILASTLGFVLSFYSYNSFRIIIPIWTVILFAYKFREFINIRKYWAVLSISLGLFLLSLIPVYRLYRYDAGGVRFADVQITGKVDFVKNYFSHFSPGFLLSKGDTNPRSQIPGHGELYLFEIPLILFGLFVIVRSKKVLLYLPLVALVLAPVPAALTRESPHALRAILAAPAFAMISAIGVGFIAEKIKKIDWLIFFAAAVIYLLAFEPYMTDFINKYPMETAADWQYPYKEIFTNQRKGAVTDKYAQPYIFALFYQKYPPEKFRKEAVLNPVNEWGFSKVASFDGFQFK